LEFQDATLRIQCVSAITVLTHLILKCVSQYDTLTVHYTQHLFKIVVIMRSKVCKWCKLCNCASFKGRVQCFSMQVIIKYFLLNL